MSHDCIVVGLREVGGPLFGVLGRSYAVEGVDVAEPIGLQLQHFIALVSGAVDPEQERQNLLAPHVIAQTIEDRAKEAAG